MTFYFPHLLGVKYSACLTIVTSISLVKAPNKRRENVLYKCQFYLGDNFLINKPNKAEFRNNVGQEQIKDFGRKQFTKHTLK